MGHNLGFHATVAHVAHLSLPLVITHRIIADFSAIYQGSVTITVHPLLRFFLHDLSNRHFLIYSRFSLVARGLRHHYDSVSHHTGDFFLLLFLTLAPHDHVTYCQAQGLSGHTSPCGECGLFILGLSPWTGRLLGWFSTFLLLSGPWHHVTTSPTARHTSPYGECFL